MKELTKLKKAKHSYDKAILEMEEYLSDKISFEFSIEYQESDGFCILNLDNAKLIHLGNCLQIIKTKGLLSDEDLNYESI